MQVRGVDINSSSLRKDVLVGVCASKKRRAPASRPPPHDRAQDCHLLRLPGPFLWPRDCGLQCATHRSNLASPASGRYAFVCVCAGPARRASRKLLERIVEFVRLAGGESKIVEYNQEACRLHSFDGKKSLIRSFPSAPAHQTTPTPLVCAHTAFALTLTRSKVGVRKKRDANSNTRGD